MLLFNRKKKGDAPKKKKNRSPHLVPPKIGPYPTHGDSGEAFPCMKCGITIEIQHDEATFKLEQVFTALYSRFDIFFPISECGNSHAFTCHVNNHRLYGDLVREKDGRLLPASDPVFEAEEKRLEEERRALKKAQETGRKPGIRGAAEKLGDDYDPDSIREKDEPPPPVYYFLVRDAGKYLTQHPDGVKRGTRLEMVFEVKVKGFLKGNICSVPFPLSCCPKSPDTFAYKIEMKDNIRRVSSPNRSHPIFPYVTGKKAEVTLDITPDRKIRLEDYIFVLQVELGEPITPQCADPVALLVLASAIGGMLFMTLTRDLEDY